MLSDFAIRNADESETFHAHGRDDVGRLIAFHGKCGDGLSDVSDAVERFGDTLVEAQMFGGTYDFAVLYEEYAMKRSAGCAAILDVSHADIMQRTDPEGRLVGVSDHLLDRIGA